MSKVYFIKKYIFCFIIAMLSAHAALFGARDTLTIGEWEFLLTQAEGIINFNEDVKKNPSLTRLCGNISNKLKFFRKALEAARGELDASKKYLAKQKISDLQNYLFDLEKDNPSFGCQMIVVIFNATSPMEIIRAIKDDISAASMILKKGYHFDHNNMQAFDPEEHLLYALLRRIQDFQRTCFSLLASPDNLVNAGTVGDNVFMDQMSVKVSGMIMAFFIVSDQKMQGLGMNQVKSDACDEAHQYHTQGNRKTERTRTIHIPQAAANPFAGNTFGSSSAEQASTFSFGHNPDSLVLQAPEGNQIERRSDYIEELSLQSSSLQNYDAVIIDKIEGDSIYARPGIFVVHANSKTGKFTVLAENEFFILSIALTKKQASDGITYDSSTQTTEKNTYFSSFLTELSNETTPVLKELSEKLTPNWKKKKDKGSREIGALYSLDLRSKVVRAGDGRIAQGNLRECLLQNVSELMGDWITPILRIESKKTIEKWKDQLRGSQTKELLKLRALGKHHFSIKLPTQEEWIDLTRRASFVALSVMRNRLEAKVEAKRKVLLELEADRFRETQGITPQIEEIEDDQQEVPANTKATAQEIQPHQHTSGVLAYDTAYVAEMKAAQEDLASCEQALLDLSEDMNADIYKDFLAQSKQAKKTNKAKRRQKQVPEKPLKAEESLMLDQEVDDLVNTIQAHIRSQKAVQTESLEAEQANTEAAPSKTEWEALIEAEKKASREKKQQKKAQKQGQGNPQSQAQKANANKALRSDYKQFVREVLHLLKTLEGNSGTRADQVNQTVLAILKKFYKQGLIENIVESTRGSHKGIHIQGDLPTGAPRGITLMNKPEGYKRGTHQAIMKSMKALVRSELSKHDNQTLSALMWDTQDEGIEDFITSSDV